MQLWPSISPRPDQHGDRGHSGGLCRQGRRSHPAAFARSVEKLRKFSWLGPRSSEGNRNPRRGLWQGRRSGQALQKTTFIGALCVQFCEIVNVGRDKEVLSNSLGSPMALLLHAVVGIQVHVFFCLEPIQFCLNCDMSVRSRLV